MLPQILFLEIMDSAKAMQDFLQYVLTHLVDHPDEATITTTPLDDGDGHLFTVTVKEGDVGCVIGKNGVTISALRSLLDASAEKFGTKARLKVRGQDEVEED